MRQLVAVVLDNNDTKLLRWIERSEMAVFGCDRQGKVRAGAR